MIRLLHPPIEPWLHVHAEGLRVRLLLRDAEGADLEAWVRTLPDNEEALLPMRRAADVAGAAAMLCLEAELPWDGSNDCTLYAFKLREGATTRWLAADGEHAHVPPEATHFRVSRLGRPPDWVASQVVYQIFPDRYARGAAGPAPQRGTAYGDRPVEVGTLAWGAPVPRGAQQNHVFYGGDLAGIVRRLDYLGDELGVGTLYLNPVFASGSNHRYDTEDYEQVDPHLGGNAGFAALMEAARARGMRVLLDAVINHTGSNHPWFNRWGRHATIGAAQSPDSPWRRWYAFDATGRPLGWKGYASLPVLDYAEPAVLDAMVTGEHAVLRRWLRAPYAIDGWRLDAIHMLGEGPGASNNAALMRTIRRAVRETRPDAWLIGEHFNEATRWLQGDQEDGAMNYYGFAQPLRCWLAGSDLAGHPSALSTAAFEHWLARARATVPYANQLAQLNLLGSHDTARFATLVGGDLERLATAVALLMSYPGVPCIYYGDEIGLEGDNDPDCRRCFPWQRSHWNEALLAHYRALVALRRTRRELQSGAFLTLAAGDDWLAYARYDAEAATLVLANRGGAVAADLDLAALPLAATRWRSALPAAVFEARAGRLAVRLPARGCAVLVSG